MSASPIARQATHSQVIPSRRVLITDPAQMPDVYSSTPGGTLYSTTPGGTRIVYERSFMMSLRQSPISQTPPKCLLPAALLKNPGSVPHTQTSPTQKNTRSNSISFDESQETFSMDL
ncbi:eukaryotic translation initiation factor 4E binding protein thor [Aphomia sociella]